MYVDSLKLREHAGLEELLMEAYRADICKKPFNSKQIAFRDDVARDDLGFLGRVDEENSMKVCGEILLDFGLKESACGCKCDREVRSLADEFFRIGFLRELEQRLVERKIVGPVTDFLGKVDKLGRGRGGDRRIHDAVRVRKTTFLETVTDRTDWSPEVEEE